MTDREQNDKEKQTMVLDILSSKASNNPGPMAWRLLRLRFKSLNPDILGHCMKDKCIHVEGRREKELCECYVIYSKVSVIRSPPFSVMFM